MMDKQTKIVATISDLRCDVEFLKSLYDAGVNVFRLNTAHQSEEDSLKVIRNVRKVSNTIPVIVDTKGPEVRTTVLEGEPIVINKGEKFLFKGGSEKETSVDCIYLNYDNFEKEVSIGSRILYDDGEIEFVVRSKKGDGLVCVAQNSGVLKGKKSMNVPGVNLNLPSLTVKDKKYVEFSAKNGVDFIAHSFIRNKNDLIAIQRILDKQKSNIKLIAKIENQDGVDNIDEILDNCYGVMVARGDLAIEIPAEKVPSIQKMIINKCIEKRKIVITATQMLHTMIDNPRPTRAEVSDIANAIYDGTDCVMLSGETAYGKYPLEAVKVMTKVAREVEKEKKPFKKTAVKAMKDEVPDFLAKSAIRASLRLPIKAIMTDTLSGRTAMYLSGFRGKSRIYALCYNKEVLRKLAFSYGVYADMVSVKERRTLFAKKIKELVDKKLLKKTDMIVVVSGSFGPTKGASRIEIGKVEDLLKSSFFV